MSILGTHAHAHITHSGKRVERESTFGTRRKTQLGSSEAKIGLIATGSSSYTQVAAQTGTVQETVAGVLDASTELV